jgi:hypothetical protein
MASKEGRELGIGEAGQLILILTPIAYLIGRQYISGILDVYGCGWAIYLLSFEQIITYSVTPILPVLTGVIFTSVAVFDGNKSWGVMKWSFWIFILCISLAIIIRVTYSFHLANILLMITSLYTLYIFGVYLADVIFKIGSGRLEQIRSSASTLFGTIVFTYASVSFLGVYMGSLVTGNPGKYLAELRDPIIQGAYSETYLITRTSNGFLIMHQRGDDRSFRIVDSLKDYKITAKPSNFY